MACVPWSSVSTGYNYCHRVLLAECCFWAWFHQPNFYFTEYSTFSSRLFTVGDDILSICFMYFFFVFFLFQKINVRNHHNPDPFIFNGKSESYDHDIYSPRSSPWGSPSPPNGLISFYHQTQPQSRDGAFDQFCPSTSSGPSSPASGDNNLAYNLYSVASPYALDAADHFHIKDEPFDEAGGVFEADYFGGAGGLPPLDAASEAFANIPLLNSQDFDDERYQDFMQAFGVDAFAATAPPEPNCSAVQLPLNFLAFTALMDGMNESDDGDDDDGETTTTPGGSVSDSRQSSIITAPSSSASAAAAGRPVRPNAAASRATRMKKENGSKKRVDFAANVCSKLDSLRAAAVTSSAGPATASSSRRTSVASMSPSMSITSNTSDEDLPGGGHSKSSKRSSKSISPEGKTFYIETGVWFVDSLDICYSNILMKWNDAMKGLNYFGSSDQAINASILRICYSRNVRSKKMFDSIRISQSKGTLFNRWSWFFFINISLFYLDDFSTIDCFWQSVLIWSCSINQSISRLDEDR